MWIIELAKSVDIVMDLIVPGFLFYYSYFFFSQKTIEINIKTILYSSMLSYIFKVFIPFTGYKFYLCILGLIIIFFFFKKIKLFSKLGLHYTTCSDSLYELSEKHGSYITIVSYEKNQIIQGELRSVGFYEKDKRKIEIGNPDIYRFEDCIEIFDSRYIIDNNKEYTTERRLIYTESEKDVLFIDYFVDRHEKDINKK